MSHVYQRILEKYNASESQFVVLIDPEKVTMPWLEQLMQKAEQADVQMYFIGGSTLSGAADDVVDYVKGHTSKDVVLFPGNVEQIVQGVDAVLFLSLVSGRNAEYLIDSHVRAVPLLKGLEVIAVGYILIDGGHISSTQQVTSTLPLSPNDVEHIVHTAIASELLGHKMIYLEAGSGALNPIPARVIAEVKKHIHVPLIVGGGICTAEQMQAAYQAGADLVVVGNALEQDFSLLTQ